MTREEKHKGEIVFVCGECGMKYRKKERAEECEAWCKVHHTCNIEIIKNAVEED